ncbi:MAG: phosphate ABC transporter permease subunit PstC [Treponema sp.]|jgi:phosphate transport system permease protein|nr:phosphate ABC transporter permease subunit PstC [Treponema sp.]
MNNRKKIDRFFMLLFTATSLISVTALGAILVFVFVQGAEPFAVSTAPGIQLVVEGIGEFTVNGEPYQQEQGTVTLPGNIQKLSIHFAGGGGERILELGIDNTEKNPEKKLLFVQHDEGEISYPQAYVYTVSYSGIMAGIRQRIHILLPEPPYSFFRFISGSEWRPTYNKVYGILPMIAGTILASFGALILGVPIAILCALFLAEFLSEKTAAVARSCIELLAGIPSVVYGFFGLMILVPLVKNTFHVPSGNGLLSATIILAVMILPTVITIAETSMRAVPHSQREASLALGASKMQTAWRIVLVHARSGVIAGIILGVSRAVGETMAVILVAGNSVQMIRSPLDSIRTLTATIALEMGYAQGRHGSVLFSIGAVLFILILILNSAILFIRRRELS